MEINITLEVKYKFEGWWYCFMHAVQQSVKGNKIETHVGEFPKAEDHEEYLRGDEDRDDTRCIDCMHDEAVKNDWFETKYGKRGGA